MSYSVRNAEPEDLPDLLRMARRFYGTTAYARQIELSDADAVNLLAMMATDGVLLVVERDDGGLCGMVGLGVVPFIFNSSILSAHEVFWWVDPEDRGEGAGRALLAAIEPACRRAGASRIHMITLADSPPHARSAYENAGYALSESTFVKEL